MTYAVKEIFYTLQGEGANAGRAAVFCRFAGCNLWSGREADRAEAVCRIQDLIERGEANRADAGLAFDLEGDQHRIKRDSLKKRLCSVEVFEVVFATFQTERLHQ